MKKTTLKVLCITNLVVYTDSAYGMQKINELMHQGIAKSSSIMHAIPGVLREVSDRAGHGAHYAANGIAQLYRTSAELATKGARASIALPGIIYRTSLALIKKHPKKSVALGASLGAFGAFFITRTAFVRHAVHNAQQRLALRLLRSNNRYLISYAFRLGADVNHRFEGGKTALHNACEQGRANIVEFLLLHGANIRLSDAQHFNAIHYAATNGHIDVVARLVHYGENIDVVTDDAARRSPLHIAAEAGQLEMARWLIQHGANDQLQTADGRTAQALTTHQHVAQYLTQIRPGTVDHWFTGILHNAINEGEVQRARIAINSGAHMVHADVNQTPLRRAIGAYNAEHATAADEIAEALVRAGAPLHTRDRDGNTPLHYAVARENIRLSRLFLERGANARVQNTAHETALDIAIRNRNRQMTNLLTEHGARLTAEQIAANPWLNEPEQPAQAQALNRQQMS